jgi:predicted nucleotidyltransferase
MDTNEYKQVHTLLADELNVKELRFQTPAIVDGSELSLLFVKAENKYYYVWGDKRQEAIDDSELLLKVLKGVS